MIDRGDIRQAIDRCSNIWASLPGAGYGQFEHKADSPQLQNSKKRAERSERLMYEQSHRDCLRSGYHHPSACHGLLIITVITPCLQKASATKMPENEAGERGNYWHADASAWCCCARCKIREGVGFDAKAENDALRDDVAAGRRRLRIKAVCQSVREATTASGWIMQPPPTGRHRWTGLFTLRERLITMQKQLEGTQKYINEQCR